MDEPIYFDEEFKAKWRYAFEQAKADRERYFNWLKGEIEVAVDLINRYDKVYILGGLGAMLLKVSPNFYNQFIEAYEGPDNEEGEDETVLSDEEIETILEYAMSIASASENKNAGIIPTHENIEEIRDLLAKIKFNVGFYEMSAENPKDGNEFDHLLKMRVMQDALNVRGNGYTSHVIELYTGTFAPHDGFLEQFYGFNSRELLETLNKLDGLVGSKIQGPFGSTLAYDRLFTKEKVEGVENEEDEIKKFEKMIKTMMGAGAENKDLVSGGGMFNIQSVSLDDIESYGRLFWVIPATEKEKKIFEVLSHQFGDNTDFLGGKFGGFPLGDSVIYSKPILKVDDKYYWFSHTLAFRNIFNITAKLLQDADAVYYEQRFRNNASSTSRDNYIERKVKSLFEIFLPTVKFYHSLDYQIVEDGIDKKPELDILGIGDDTIYIIEVKAGELNKKHRRGALLGLKDRITETINEGSYQCYRAEKFINESTNPEFTFVENIQRKSLVIDKNTNYHIIKISVTYEHFADVSVNLKYLIDSGVLSADYKWTWIVSIFDLMIFADLIESEADFKEYLRYRIGLYDRSDVEFNDEIDILGFFIQNRSPLPSEKTSERIMMIGYKDEIDKYYTRKDVGMPGVIKVKRKS